MNTMARTALALTVAAATVQASAQVTFYEREGFDGRSFTADRQVRSFTRFGFNDRASSAVVQRGRWEVCTDVRFEGRCVLLRRGRYASLDALGLNDRISSVRPVQRATRYDDDRAPLPQPVYDSTRRPNERLFEAPVTSVRAVVGPPQNRCWVERQQVSRGEGTNVPGAIAGAFLGGILGHQIGGGTGRDLATAGGVVAGAAVGSNIGRDDRAETRDVQRCASVPGNARPEFWDVTYDFRGTEHRIQTMAPPGATVTVNRDGEPRG